MIGTKEIFTLIDNYLNPKPEETTESVEKKKKKKNNKPIISLEKSKASTLIKSTSKGSGEQLDEYDEEDDDFDEYCQEYDEMYGQYLK